MKDFVTAMQQKLSLINDSDIKAEELDKVKITALKEFKSHFSFPEVARNDFSMDQLDQLEIAEKNFNADIDNKDLLKALIKTGNEVKKALKEHYGDQWTDPADGEVPSEGDE